MKHKKKLKIILIVIIVIPIIYYIYCQVFLEIFYSTYRDDFSFKIDSVVNNDSSVNNSDYKNYIWERTIIEPRHGQWINKTTLCFCNDSLLFVSVRPSYIEGKEFTFPLLFPLGLEIEEKPFNYLYKIRNDSLFNFSTNKFYTSFKLKDNKIFIKDVFL